MHVCIYLYFHLEIKMPPIIRKRGRPKGHNVTVIGLPKKKKFKSSRKKLLPFISMHISDKQKRNYATYITILLCSNSTEFFFSYLVMLRWFVSEELVDQVLKDDKQLIEEADVELRPEKIPDGIRDENVDIHLIRKFFTNDAWLVLYQATEMKRQSEVYVCKVCSSDLGKAPSIVCDHCLEWSHSHCVGLKKTPKRRYWFCRTCHDTET